MRQKPHLMAKVWRGIKDIDVDKNGFLVIDELELCFREQFAYEMENKSCAYFFRRFSTDHDKSLVNYRNIKLRIMERIEDLGGILATRDENTNSASPTPNRNMVRSKTVA